MSLQILKGKLVLPPFLSPEAKDFIRKVSIAYYPYCNCCSQCCPCHCLCYDYCYRLLLPLLSATATSIATATATATATSSTVAVTAVANTASAQYSMLLLNTKHCCLTVTQWVLLRLWTALLSVVETSPSSQIGRWARSCNYYQGNCTCGIKQMKQYWI